MSNLISVLFQIAATILLIKLYHDLIVKKLLLSKSKDANSWGDTTLALEKMEDRLKKMQSREIAGQERVWKLEDENRILLSHVQQLRLITYPTEHEPEDDQEDWQPDQDDDDEPRAV